MVEAEGMILSDFQVFDEYTTGKQNSGDADLENSWYPSEDQPELALKLVRFPDPSPNASLPQLTSMDEHSSFSKNIEDTFKRQSRETSRGTPMSVLCSFTSRRK